MGTAKDRGSSVKRLGAGGDQGSGAMGLISGFTSARRLRISTTALPVESGESRIAGALVSIIFVGLVNLYKQARTNIMK